MFVNNLPPQSSALMQSAMGGSMLNAQAQLPALMQQPTANMMGLTGITGTAGGLGAQAGGVIGGLLNAVSGILQGVSGLLQSVVQLLPRSAPQASGAIVAQGATPSGATSGAAVGSGANAPSEGGGFSFSNILSGGLDFLKDAFSGLISTGAEKIGGFLGSKMGGIGSFLQGAGKSVLSFLGGLF